MPPMGESTGMVSVAHLGSRPLGRKCLELMDEHPDVTVEAVVTYPEDHDGWWEGSLNATARELGYPIVDEDTLFEYDLDYLVSTLYYNILDEELLSHPTHGGVNLHQAELPRYRGSNTFSHAIMNAREDDHWQYGTTLHFMSPEVDAGDVIDRKFVEITEEATARSLYEKTERASVGLFAERLDDLVSGAVEEMRTPQDQFESKSYFYAKTSLDGEKAISPAAFHGIDEHALYDRVRALDFPPFEPAYLELGDGKIYLTKSMYGEVPGEQ